MATKTNSADGTSNMTAAEMKAKYAELSKHIENYESAESAVKKLKDYTKTYVNNRGVFDKEKLRNYLKNITSNEKNLRNLSWFLYYRSQPYARLCHFYGDMFDLNARSVVPNIDITKNYNTGSVLKSYYQTLTMLESMRVQDELAHAFLTCFIQDVYYGVVWYDSTGIFIMDFPADYAKIYGKYVSGDFSFAIDCSYFNKYKELLEYYPEPFKKMYDNYQRTKEKWQVVPPEHSLCLKFRGEDINTVLSPLAAMLNEVINLIDLEDVQAVADKQSIYKMLWLELETISGSKNIDDWKIDPALVVNYFNKMIEDALPDYISAAIVPGKLQEISFPDDQTSDTNKLVSATEAVLNLAGGAEILNGATINNTYAFKLACIQNTEYAISSLLPQAQSWVNRFLADRIQNPAKVKFFPISVYTKEDYKDSLLKAANNGLPAKLAYNTLNGFSELDTLRLNYLEEEILNLGERLVPLSTSYTQSGKDDNDKAYDPEPSGAPTKDAKDLTDSGDRSRNR